MRRTREDQQPSRDRRPLHKRSQGKAWLPRGGEVVLSSGYIALLPGEKQGKHPSPTCALRFQNLTSGSLAGSGLRLLLPVAFGSAAAGSCVRCRRFRRDPGIFV